MKFVRRKLSEDAVQPANTRWDETCDCVETRASAASPWIDTPAADPRHADSFRLPAREGGTAKCDAAEAMTQHFKASVDAFLTSANILLFVNAIIAIVGVFFAPIALFSKAIFILFEALLTIGTTVVDEAMTEEVYEQIKCILFNNIGEDGQMSAAQLATIQSQIDSEIGGTPNLVFDLFAGLWGEVQWSNAGATGEYTGDCEECAEGTCFEQVYVAGSAPINLYFHSGEWNTGGALNSNWTPYTSLNVSINLGDTVGTCQYDSAAFDYEVIGTGTDEWYLYGMNDPSPFAGGQTELDNGTISTGSGTVNASFTPAEFYGLQLVIFSIDSDETEVRVFRIQICSPNLSSAGLTSNCDLCP